MESARFVYELDHGGEGEEEEEEDACFLDIYVHGARGIHNICIYAAQDVYARLALTSSPDDAPALDTRVAAGGGANPRFDERLPPLRVRRRASAPTCSSARYGCGAAPGGCSTTSSSASRSCRSPPSRPPTARARAGLLAVVHRPLPLAGGDHTALARPPLRTTRRRVPAAGARRRRAVDHVGGGDPRASATGGLREDRVP